MDGLLRGSIGVEMSCLWQAVRKARAIRIKMASFRCIVHSLRKK
jgi:hypothetical protein